MANSNSFYNVKKRFLQVALKTVNGLPTDSEKERHKDYLAKHILPVVDFSQFLTVFKSNVNLGRVSKMFDTNFLKENLDTRILVENGIYFSTSSEITIAGDVKGNFIVLDGAQLTINVCDMANLHLQLINHSKAFVTMSGWSDGLIFLWASELKMRLYENSATYIFKNVFSKYDIEVSGAASYDSREFGAPPVLDQILSYKN